MGAIHNGHLSLVEASKKENDVTVCSVFVNPTQFNNANDLEKYPVTLEKDVEALFKSGCDVVFMPAVNEIYPPGYDAPVYDLGNLQTVLEGKHRPGHFQGVCQVVDRLLQIVEPHNLYLGQKDYQQCKVIGRLLHLTRREDTVNLSIVPTLREYDGLAMSSRNLRLNEQQRKKAPFIYQCLIRAKALLENNASVQSAINEAEASLHSHGFKVDYFAVADAETLSSPSPSSNAVILTAVWLDDIRLIDNLPLTKWPNQAG